MENHSQISVRTLRIVQHSCTGYPDCSGIIAVNQGREKLESGLFIDINYSFKS